MKVAPPAQLEQTSPSIKKRARTSIQKTSTLLGGLLLAGSLSAQSLTLSWTDSSQNEEGFFVERATGGGAFSLLAKTIENQNSFVDSEVVPGEFYEYRVCSFNAFGRSDYLASRDLVTVERDDSESSFNVKVDNDENPIVRNGGFEGSLSPWRFYSNAAGSANNNTLGYGSTGSAIQIRLDRQGSNMQLFQNSLTLEADTEYELSFAAYSNSGRDMRVTLAKHTSPYTNYGLNKELIDLDTDWSVVRVRFTTDNLYSTVGNGRLYFWFADDARAGDRYYIDDVRIRKADDPLPEGGTDEVDPAPEPEPETDDNGDSTDGGDTTEGGDTTDNGDTTAGGDTGTDGGEDESETDEGDDSASDGGTEGPIEVPEFETGVGVVKNGTFEENLSDWTFYTSGKGRAYLSTPGYQGSDSSALVRLDSSANNIQLFQNDIELLPNTPYRLTFAASCNLGRDMSVSLSKHSTPYTNYGLSNLVVDLDEEWNVYTITFTTTGFDEPVADGRLYFWFADRTWGGEQYRLDNISLTALPDVDAPTVPSSLKSKRITGRKVQLNWEASVDNGGEVGYIIYRDGIDFGVSAVPEFLDTDAAGPHVYHVTAFDSDGNESALSGSASVAR